MNQIFTLDTSYRYWIYRK